MELARTKAESPFWMNNGECLAHDFIELMKQKNVSFSQSYSNANFDYDTLWLMPSTGDFVWFGIFFETNWTVRQKDFDSKLPFSI